MPAKQPRLFPSLQKQLVQLGERLRAARLRRHYTIETVCIRANIARATLYRAEAGDSAVALGTYARILKVLGLDNDLSLVAKDDLLGRRLQDMELPQKRIRNTKRTSPETIDDQTPQ
ncbi:MAG: hypothetical protein A3J38_10405 [Gammaproteobacteria bacterium RIFCSPHIGHO2_12_FULL_45_9]|nr:MAG: hypothetical protein A3J38_10405 [Gammaproteobacteria bacterium RIFCSPHIGHO2_12_FULL_45_9]